jgi:hypothetical protein
LNVSVLCKQPGQLFSWPKFLPPAFSAHNAVSSDTGVLHKEQISLQLEVLMEEVQQLVSPTIKNYVKFYTTSLLGETAGDMEISAEELLNLYEELYLRHSYIRVQVGLTMEQRFEPDYDSCEPHILAADTTGDLGLHHQWLGENINEFSHQSQAILVLHQDKRITFCHIKYKEYPPVENIVLNSLQVTKVSTEPKHKTVLVMARDGSISPGPGHYSEEDLCITRIKVRIYDVANGSVWQARLS